MQALTVVSSWPSPPLQRIARRFGTDRQIAAELPGSHDMPSPNEMEAHHVHNTSVVD